MKITKKELRKIINDLNEAADMTGMYAAPRPGAGLNHRTMTSEFASAISELGPDRFAAALVRAIGDLENADDMLAFIRRMG